MNNSDNEMGPFGRSFVGDFPTLGTMLILLSTFFISALFSLGNLIPFLILFIISSSSVVYLSFYFIEPHFNSKPSNKLVPIKKNKFSLDFLKETLTSGSERPKKIITFTDAIKNFFKNWANFRGRASRSEHNWPILFFSLLQIPLSIISIVLGILLVISEDSEFLFYVFLSIYLIYQFLHFLFFIFLIIPSTTILIRRLHDIGYSGWYYLFYVVISLFTMVISLLISEYLFILICILFSIPLYLILILPGENRDNKYGSIPNNKLNLFPTSSSIKEVWDFSGSNLSRLFQNKVVFSQGRDSHGLNRKGPIIGNWESENKLKTWLKVGIVFVITNISLYLVLAISLLMIFGGFIDSDSSLYGFNIILSSFFFTSIILVTLYMEDKFIYFQDLFSIPNIPKSILLIILVSIIDAILVILWILFYDFVFPPPPDLGYEQVAETTFGLILIFISLTIAAPIFEEILFRGYLLDKIRSVYSDNFAILSTGFLFGIMHWNIFFWSDFLQVGSATIGGFLYAWLRIKTGSLWPSIICHALWNGTIFFLVFV